MLTCFEKMARPATLLPITRLRARTEVLNSSHILKVDCTVGVEAVTAVGIGAFVAHDLQGAVDKELEDIALDYNFQVVLGCRI
jgi:hypothetical protein